MKKILLTMFVCMMFVLSGCTSVNEKEVQESITISTLNEKKEVVQKEVPFQPKRIAILDMSALDIIDALDLGERIVGSTNVSIDYISEYAPNDQIMHLGTIKQADLEKVAACQPDIIFIGGRLASVYQELEAIAPVVYLGVDYQKGVVESTKENALTIASIFGKEKEVSQMFDTFQPRIDALQDVLKDKNVLLSMYNANTLALMNRASQLNIICNELGANNLADDIESKEQAAHGEEASWETIMTLNPEYLFVLNRNSAIQASVEAGKGAQEVIENELIKTLDVYKENKIVYLIEHANVWYTATGGIQALDLMLKDLEQALL